jgi:ribosomal protein L11 methyltransferase
MGQIRLFASSAAPAIQQASRILGLELEEDGIPVSAFEEDEATGLWNLSIYCQPDEADRIRDRMAQVLADHGIAEAIGEEALADDGWVEKTLRALAPVRAGRFVVHGSHDRASPQPHECAIEIDAGLAFGTGHHGTTAGCLAVFDDLLRGNTFRNVLDVGSGSGVLAIAAAKRGCPRVLASDIDPVAVAVARENARINAVASRVDCVTAAGMLSPAITRRAPYDLVLANILAPPLQAMARDLAAAVRPGGFAILSGLLPQQKARILAAYRLQGMCLVRAHVREGWLTLLLVKG